jgi:hypothetical protein
MDSQPQPQDPNRLISDWDENDVHFFLTNLGLPQYEAKVKGQLVSLLFSIRRLSSNVNYRA